MYSFRMINYVFIHGISPKMFSLHLMLHEEEGGGSDMTSFHPLGNIIFFGKIYFSFLQEQLVYLHCCVYWAQKRNLTGNLSDTQFDYAFGYLLIAFCCSLPDYFGYLIAEIGYKSKSFNTNNEYPYALGNNYTI